MGSRSGEAVPVKGLPALYLSVDAPLLVQSSSTTLRNLSKPQLWSSHLAGAHERQAFDHRCGRVAKLALKRRRVQQRCPRAPTPEPGKGRRPKNRQSQWRKVFLPGCSVVPGRWFSGPAPSGSCLLLFRMMFLSTGRGRHVPAPSGRDVGSNSGGTDPRTGPFLGIPLRASSWCSFFLFLFALITLFYYWRFWPFPRFESVHRVCQAISIFSGARVLPGDWDPIAPGRRLWMTMRQRPLSLFMQHVISTSAFCTARGS